MKKLYKTPEIVFESFSLDVSIASGCAVGTNAVQGACGYDMGWGMYIFFQGIDACIVKITDESDLNNKVCYHNPTDETRLFSS